MLIEETDQALSVALRFIERLVNAGQGEQFDAAAIPFYDLEFLLFRVRQQLLGDRIATDTACQAPGCAARVDISFGIDDYLRHHRPLGQPWKSRTWEAVEAELHWYRLMRRADGTELGLFRLPTARDLVELQHTRGASERLAERCIRPRGRGHNERRVIEGAMHLIAPCLSGNLSGYCPACGAPISVLFEPRQYFLAELRERAQFVLEDVHLLAEHYHWSESEILAMPNRRRVAYAELARHSHVVT
ncbi:hypothetical protein G3N95_12025 [Paraburkholderia sp. Tr-20389]|uniref:hypothetical protein n=1 Tax=Paraburkholderia sp. Tr-20389 TaxID=2703903 RepID=UPI00197EEAA6|nr:hypothetical protein [Paraburkholderia sp. Tr-20389]MBN3753669.1 hypothetical protein [Paraburkholderia sp. Tr-20389]